MINFDWPFFALEDDIREKLKQCVVGKINTAVATLVDCAGSSPRPLGSQMLVGEDKEVFGYVSGGCVESNLAEIAIEAIKNKKPQFITFGSGSPYMDVKLLCGKRIDVAVDYLAYDEKAVEKLLEFTACRKDFFWFSDFNKNQRLCFEFSELEKNVPSEIAAKINENPNAGFYNNCYWKKYSPKTRIIINGGNPVAMALMVLTKNMGFEVILNRKHGTDLPENITVDQYLKLDARKLFKEIKLDSKTAVVSLTHDLEEDNEIMVEALPSSAFYVGVLGSFKHMPARKSLFKKAGLDEKHLTRLSSPIGLDINAANANEIAIAILAEIIAKKNCSADE